MLEEDKNRLLTQVGPGTPMGNLMRRYWHPIAAVGEFDEKPVKAVRLMGEDLTLYRDLSGTYGLVDRHCPHRRADLSYGFVEKCGLRCNYHGWAFDETGQCIEQPYEQMADPTSDYHTRIRIKAYKAQAHAGMVWAYMGPEPAPLLPNWELFNYPNGFKQIVFCEVPCNWLQGQENSIDPVHFEWMHDNWSVRLKGNTGPYAPKHLKIDFEEFEYGIQYKRIREGSDETSPLWTVGRVCLWPNTLFTGNHFEWRVPVDDGTTLSVAWFFSRVPKDREPYVQNSIPYWYSWLKDPKTGRWIDSHIMNQDFVAWVGQGTVSDRWNEHLGRSDRGIMMLRKRFLADLEAIEQGKDPKAVIRDPEINKNVTLPIAARNSLMNGVTREELEKDALSGLSRRDFAWLIGQPDEVKRAYHDAMGF
jgi:5,5'-dehydrodivanillate O-demethylase